MSSSKPWEYLEILAEHKELPLSAVECLLPSNKYDLWVELTAHFATSSTVYRFQSEFSICPWKDGPNNASKEPQHYIFASTFVHERGTSCLAQSVRSPSRSKRSFRTRYSETLTNKALAVVWFGGDYYKLWSVNIKKYVFCVVLPILRSCKENCQNLLSFENIFEFSRSKMIRFWQLVLTLKCQGLAFSVHDPHLILIIQFGDRTSPFVRAVQLLAWNVSRLLVPQPKPRPEREETDISGYSIAYIEIHRKWQELI